MHLFAVSTFLFIQNPGMLREKNLNSSNIILLHTDDGPFHGGAERKNSRGCVEVTSFH